MRRPLPERVGRNYRRALNAGLTHALGRALYLENRLQNAGSLIIRGHVGSQRYPNPRTPEEFMRTTRPETAKRWAAHYRKGGSIRTLSDTVESRNEKRRARHKERQERYPEGQTPRRVLVRVLRQQGFQKDQYREPQTFTKVLHERRLIVQLWGDGGHRVTFAHAGVVVDHFGCQNTYPTYFRSVEQMAKALEFESSRPYDTEEQRKTLLTF